MQLKELTSETFDNFAISFSPNSPYQTSFYGDTMVKEGYNPIYLGLIDNDKILAATMILVQTDGKFKYGYVPRGYLIDFSNTLLVNEFSKQLKRYLSMKNIVAIKISPNLVKNIFNSNYELISKNDNYSNIFNNLMSNGYNHLGYNMLFESYKPRYDAVIDLNGDVYTLFNNMSKEYRTKVRSAEDNGIRIHKGTESNIETLYNQVKNKYPRGLDYFKDLYKNFNKKGLIELYYAKLEPNVYLKKNQLEYEKDDISAYQANEGVLRSTMKSDFVLDRKMKADKALMISKAKLSDAVNLMRKYPDGVIVATVLVVKMNDTVTVLMDSFDRKYSSFNAKHLIIWKLIEKFSADGFKYFNLGGIAGRVEKTNKYYGLNSYKLGFGSRVYEYSGDFEFVTNMPLYLIYKNSFLFKKNKK